MKKTLFALLTIIATLISSSAVRAEITTVILSENEATQFTVSAENDPKDTEALTFSIGMAVPDGDKVKKCTLRVVPTPLAKLPRADQDVAVLWNIKQVGQWSAYSQTIEPYAAELMPEACAPGSKVFTLKTETKFTKWEYYGGSADIVVNQPRLIVTYDSPNPARSGKFTDWVYEKPASFFSSPMLSLTDGQELLANPVSYDGKVYVVVGSSETRGLYRLAGSEKITYWQLDFKVDKGSFAFVTAWGRLQLITTDAIHSCDLTTLATRGSVDKLLCDATTSDKITVNPGETPAMGPDGSLYFKNVEAEGRIVAYNPSLKILWRTELKLTRASPIALNASGKYAYMIADIPVESRSAENMIALLRINTATGETVSKEITYKDMNGTEVKPALQTLLRPAVASKVIKDHVVDYVFVAGNTSDTGILQLIAFDQSAKPKVVWNRGGKVAIAPVLGVKDGNSLFVVQDEDRKLKRYIWYSTEKGSTGAYSASDMKEETLNEGVASVTTLLVDGSDSVYMYADGALYAYQSASKKMTTAQEFETSVSKFLFTPGGALIGYNNSNVYDFSPKCLGRLSPTVLATGTIYSADSIAVPADAGKSVKSGERVILKGSSIKLLTGFRWPLGATFRMQSMQKSEQQPQ